MVSDHHAGVMQAKAKPTHQPTAHIRSLQYICTTRQAANGAQHAPAHSVQHLLGCGAP